MSKREGKQPATSFDESNLAPHAVTTDFREEVAVQQPPPAAHIPQRNETAFSEAQTLVRSSSNRSRSSIAKRPIPDEADPEPQPALRSMFPQYNPQLPLDRQDYYPTQTSPTHIPRGVISRPLYSPTETDNQSIAQQVARHYQTRSQPVNSSNTSVRRWPPLVLEQPVVPEPTSTDECRGLWKVVNGWKASPSEGRVYCLKMTNEKDAPIYTLSSATQPFYNIRLDPTSASAYVTVSRHDPAKPFKGTATPSASSEGVAAPGSKSESKHWQEALTTTLEEEYLTAVEGETGAPGSSPCTRPRRRSAGASSRSCSC